MFDDIVAISTGSVNVPISIIRVSGPNAFKIVKKIFSGKVGTHSSLTYGFIKEKNKIIDEVLVSWFKSPNTFTGDNVVEINAHGGVVNSNKILSLLLRNGARLADRGEFSRRSFLNGKMSLLKAEAIHDLIFAKNDAQAELSAKKFNGESSKLIKILNEKILKIIATIEINIDYPEYDDVEILTKENLIPKLKDVKKQLDKIRYVSRMANTIFNGIQIAIVGAPNAGKSSLLNSLINEEKAIVSNIEGTTRDIVEGEINLGQINLKLLDTAGIRSKADKIESFGIKKSFKAIEKADFIIHLIDSTKQYSSVDKDIEKKANNKNYLKVFNKSDLNWIKGEININSKDGDILPLIEAIKSNFKNIDLQDENILYNTRQLTLIDSAGDKIDQSIETLNNLMGPDVAIIDIKDAWEDIANILGKANNENLLDSMFSNFCLGK
ncbi:MAG: tRNA uridine-5-carboxymethylaminomethyl(34) synthesis GTPase MnmE [Mollicutes bacterium PWAP]|nr:tRNA uridine-5-carboxymethylaminomethyl(34) synthesis GTPase MnmE [Mollicutes bacterium PWAP]